MQKNEKWYMRLLIAVELAWIALIVCGLVALVQVITVRADEPRMIINGQYVIDITEAPPINRLSEALDEADNAPNIYKGISLSQEDTDLLRAILALESQGEGLDGQKAVVEVIFNRMLSSKWPDTLSGVIYQKGQFATVKNLSDPYNVPGEAEDDAISEVLNETETVLPNTDYVFFSRKKVNGTYYVRINNHWFSRGFT